MNLTCLVTGSAGFIGSHVVAALEAAGCHVAGFDVREGGGDVCDRGALDAAFDAVRPDVVFHLAAVADARAALADPLSAIRVNVGGTAAVLEAARAHGAPRVELASTCWVANAMPTGDVDESTPFLPAGGGHVYTTTKIAAEYLAHDYQRAHGVPFTILRYGIPYGPNMWPGLALRNFVDRAFAGQPLTVFGSGDASRRYLYVGDLARAHVLALGETAVNRTYHLEGAQPITTRQLAERVATLSGGAPIIFQDDPARRGELDGNSRTILCDRAQRELGWEPLVDFEDGVRRTVEWYRARRQP
jgi:UDP-glucose 4-epimerase